MGDAFRTNLDTAAVPTPAEHSEVAYVDSEASLRGKPADDLGKHRAVGLLHPAAVAADQVHVIVVTCDRVRRRAVTEVRVLDEPELLEELQRAVDGRDVHGRGGTTNCARDLLRRAVTELPDSLEHELSLGRRAVAAGTKRRLPVVRGGRAASHARNTNLRHMPHAVLALLTPDGPVLVDPTTPVLRADDFGVVRGE